MKKTLLFCIGVFINFIVLTYAYAVCENGFNEDTLTQTEKDNIANGRTGGVYFVGNFSRLDGRYPRNVLETALMDACLASTNYIGDHSTIGSLQKIIDGQTWNILTRRDGQYGNSKVFYGYYTYGLNCPQPPDSDGDGIPDKDDLDNLITTDKGLGSLCPY